MGSADPLASFQDFLAPVTVEQFRRAHLDRAPLHIPGPPDKFAGAMSWDELNRLLDMTAIWSSQSLQLALDCRMIPPERYCRRGMDRSGRPAWQPQPALVRGLLRQGASVLLNDIDTLSEGLRAVAGLLERALGARVQINLYCSWHERQAFPSHFDTHDVFALQIAGEKRWTVYRGRFDQPIAHPSFQSLGQAYHDQAKGDVLSTVDLRPGDLLYLPRGQYHDALATGATSIHLAVGATEPIGIDLLSALFEDAVADPAFRRRLPAADEAGVLTAHVGRLAARARDRLAGAEVRAGLGSLRAGYAGQRGGFPATPGFRGKSAETAGPGTGEIEGKPSPVSPGTSPQD
jgi:ribosomal protein L16 Arg81 hydroxylase